jgi:hypothetical protein
VFVICIVFAVLGLPYALFVGRGSSFGDNFVFGCVIFTLFFLVGLGHAAGATIVLSKLKEGQQEH